MTVGEQCRFVRRVQIDLRAEAYFYHTSGSKWAADICEKKADKLDAVIATLAREAWQTIDTAPKNILILGWRKNWKEPTAIYWEPMLGKWILPETCHGQPTHWRWMPKGPTDTPALRCDCGFVGEPDSREVVTIQECGSELYCPSCGKVSSRMTG